MAHVAPIYPNFARGEVSPLMFGRIDIEQYPSCLDKCRNTYIRPYGCATRLTGTEYLGMTKNSSKVRLLKFVFSPTDSYIIECGAGYFRFYQDGAIVEKTKEDVDNWVAETEYEKGDYVKINNISGSTLYYCIQSHTASNTFSDDSAYWVEQSIYEVPNNYYEDQLDSIQYVQLDDIIKLVCLPHNGDNKTARPKELIRKASDDWEFKDVEFKETPYLDQNTTDITMKASAATGDDITITASEDYFNADMVGANLWLGGTVTDTDSNEDVQGYVKITEYTDATHVKAKVEAKLSTTSATKLWGEGAFSDYRGYPAVVALFDGRLYYARTPHQPRNVYGSKPYAYETFTPAVDNEDDAGINIALATNANGDGSDIKWLIGGSYLLCGTFGGEFVIRSTGDNAITATDISARQRTNWGGEPIQPIVAGTFVHFIQRNGNKLRQFQYDFYYDSYKAVDVSIFSEHLLESPIKEMALQKNPDSIIYLVRKDGNVVMLTLEQDQSVQAWSLLEEMGARVESIQTIPSFNGNFDEVYMIMARDTIHTSLDVQCSNPSLTVTDHYSGTKETEGIEIVELTYNGTNGVWTNPDSTALNTKLSVTSNNPSLVPSTTYSDIKTEVGTITEVLEFANTGYELDANYIEAIGTPVFDRNTAIASNFNLSNYYSIYGYNHMLGFVFHFKTSEDIISRQYLVQSAYPNYSSFFIDGGYLKYNNNQTIQTICQVNANTEYWIDTTDPIVKYSTDGTNYTNTSSSVNRVHWDQIGLDRGQAYPFLGSVYFSDTKFGNNSLVLYGEWIKQGTTTKVDLASRNYQITLTGLPAIGDTLTCVWNTITHYVSLDMFQLTVVGTPSNNDLITLTYTTDFTGSERFIERMLNPITPDNPQDWWYVRSGLKYDGYQKTKGKTLTLSANSGTVTATASSSIFTSSMVDNRIRFIDSDYNILGEGNITAYTSDTVVTLEVTTYFQSQTLTGGMWGISTDSLSGLEHLNGRTVQVYADCIEQDTKTVIDGSVTIDDAFIVVVGLPYRSYITTMPMEAGSQNGTAVGKRKRISEMAIRVWNSLGVKVGRDLNNLYQTIYEQKEPFTGIIPNIKYNQGWVWDANITVEQSHPYPMNILSIAPIVTEVDK